MNQRSMFQVGLILFCCTALLCVGFRIPFAAFADSEIQDEQADDIGLLVAAAINEIPTVTFEGKIGSFERMMAARSKTFDKENPPDPDPYAAWLSTKFSFLAASGELFFINKDRIVMRVPEYVGDNKYWYVLRITGSGVTESTSAFRKTAFIWANYRSLTDPFDDLDDKIEVPGVRENEIVSLEVFKIARDRVEAVEVISGRADPAKWLNETTGNQLIRIAIPVIVSR